MTHFYTTMKSPIGEIVLTASKEGITGLYTPEHAFYAKAKTGVKDEVPFREAVKQLREYFGGRRTGFELSACLHRHRVSEAGLECPAVDPLRRDPQLRPDRKSAQSPERLACGRHGEQQKPRLHYCAVPPRDRCERKAGRLCRRHQSQEVASRARKTQFLAPFLPFSPLQKTSRPG
jgi:hypothetical protein